MEVLFYLQDIRGYCGNQILWWAKDGAGYTTDLDKAQVFAMGDAEDLIKQNPEKYRAYRCSYIEARTTKTVDMQNIRHIEA